MAPGKYYLKFIKYTKIELLASLEIIKETKIRIRIKF